METILTQAPNQHSRRLKVRKQAMNRCRAKAQTEYSECSWPTTAHVIDTIRCTVTFETEEGLRDGYVRLLQVSISLNFLNLLSPQDQRLKPGLSNP